MSEKSVNIILKYIRKWGKKALEPSRIHDAGRLWRAGDEESQKAAEEIWRQEGVHPDTIVELKEEFKPKEDEEND